jgi:hypothetical protein
LIVNWVEFYDGTTPANRLCRVKTAYGDIHLARFVAAPPDEPVEARVWLDERGRLIDRVTHWALEE